MESGGSYYQMVVEVGFSFGSPTKKSFQQPHTITIIEYKHHKSHMAVNESSHPSWWHKTTATMTVVFMHDRKQR